MTALGDPDWDHFQRTFLTALSECSSAEEVLTRLRQVDGFHESMHTWLDAMKPEMVEVAAILVQQWGEV